MLLKKSIKLFPTLVTRYDNFLSREQLSDIASYTNMSRVIEYGAIVGNGYSSYDGTSNLISTLARKFPSCISLQKKIEEALTEYTQEGGIAPVTIHSSWYNIQNPGSFLLPHTHYQSIISGALYVNLDGKSSRLRFNNPNKVISWINNEGYIEASNSQTEYNRHSVVVEAQSGTLLLFPGWLEHQSSDVNQTENRVVISFNTVYLK